MENQQKLYVLLSFFRLKNVISDYPLVIFVTLEVIGSKYYTIKDFIQVDSIDSSWTLIF